MYEAPIVEIISMQQTDIVRTSNSWSDDNVDNDGWA